VEKVATTKSHKALFLNTTAFTVCFAVWMMNGALVTFLVSNQVFDWDPVQSCRIKCDTEITTILVIYSQ
jgi:NNP family nitrate/nitrite transporter-like MFS transporter